MQPFLLKGVCFCARTETKAKACMLDVSPFGDNCLATAKLVVGCWQRWHTPEKRMLHDSFDSLCETGQVSPPAVFETLLQKMIT